MSVYTVSIQATCTLATKSLSVDVERSRKELFELVSSDVANTFVFSCSISPSKLRQATQNMNVRDFSACTYPLEMAKQQTKNTYTNIYLLACYKCKYFGTMKSKKRSNTSSTGSKVYHS